MKAKFAALNKVVMARGAAWITSIPGDPTIILEVLPDSPLIEQLLAAGYDLREEGEGQRILPNAIEQPLTLTSSGAYEALVPGSTKAVAHVVRHAGIVRVLRFKFSI